MPHKHRAPTFPLWTLAQTELYDDHGFPDAIGALTDPTDGEKYVPLFRSGIMAEAFTQHPETDGYLAVMLESAVSLLEWLPEMPANGVAHVGFDPLAGPEDYCRRVPIPDFLAELGQG